MFLPQNIKKLTNVVIISLKRHGHTYEIAAYPNKLIEYCTGATTDINTLLLSPNIYSSVSKGHLCSKEDIALFKLPHEKVIEEIIKHGVEQKSSLTRQHESSKIENEIVNFLHNRIIKNGRMVDTNEIRNVVCKFGIKSGNFKTQALLILKKMAEMGYQKKKMQIRLFSGFDEVSGVFGEVKDGVIAIEMDEYAKFKDWFSEKKINYQIISDEDIEEEVIC